MLRIAICDDDNKICSNIEDMVLEYKKSVKLDVSVEVFWTGESLVDFIKNQHSFDLIFLDIELGGITGIEVGKTIRNSLRDHISKIVFISGADGYDRQLFSMQPLNFLTKPVAKSSVFGCIDLALELLTVTAPIFEYKMRNETVRIAYQDILFFESKLKKVRIVTTDSDDEFYGSLEKTSETLPKLFVSPHRSFVVNFSFVKRIEKDTIVMANGERVPISQRGLKNLRTLQLELERERRDARI